MDSKFMISGKYIIRIPYSDTDQMGIVHHSNYAKYYETARWDLFRLIDIPYISIEGKGFQLPVSSMKTRYIKPVYYDDIISITTDLLSVKGARMLFRYKIYNQKDELVNEGETELAFIKKENRKPCPVPNFVLEALEIGKVQY